MEFYYCSIDTTGNIVNLSSNFISTFGNIIHLNNIIDDQIILKIINIEEMIELKNILIKDCLYIFNCIKVGDNILCCIKYDSFSKINLFLEYISQEVRNFLNGIIGIIELLNDTPMNNKQNEYIKIINECSSQLNNILNDFFDYTKIQTNNFILNKEPFNILECIEEAFDVITLKATQKHIEIHHLNNDFSKIIISDKLRLKQILITILEHSIKFIEENSKIIVSLIEKDNFIEFYIKCNSKNISKFNQYDIFNFNSNNINIGLILCKKILENMGGNINVVIDENLNFIFNIPYDSTNNNSIDNDLLLLKDKSILLFDTDLLSRTVLCNYFIKWKAKPILCSSEIELMIYINNHYMFDIIIFDIINNIDIKKIIIDIKKIYKDTPIIALSSNDNGNYHLLFSKIVIKPIGSLKLYNAILQLIGSNFNSKYKLDIIFKNTKLLIIENISHNQDILLKFLKKLGYIDILLVFTEQEALNAAKKQNYDVIFLNLNLACSDYIDVVKQIFKINKKNLIIALTTNDSVEIQKKCFKIGINAFLLKPIQFNDLALLMKAVENKLGNL